MVGQVFDLILQFISQIGGGPGPPENNLVRFALPAVFWGVLLLIAWSRQRQEHLPRERLLVWGFGLAFLRELVMFSHWLMKIWTASRHSEIGNWIEPIEHTLTLVALIVIATAFLRYILDDPLLSRRYMIAGLAIIILSYLASFLWFSLQPTIQTDVRFHETIPAIFLHAIASLLVAVAIIILISHRGWLSHVVVLALFFLFLGEFIILINHLTGQIHNYILCPIANNFHIWAVPLFGLVYFREQAIEKKHAEHELHAYQGHLEELVEERTVELTKANKQLERAAVLEERQRIAAEMHDGLAQTLSTLGLKTGRAEELLQKGQVEQVLDDFEQMQDVLSQAVVDVRRSISSLQESPKPPQALQDALMVMVMNEGNQSVEINDGLAGPLFLPTAEQEQILHVLREALLNASWHAQARKVTIGLAKHRDRYNVVVEDDGRGFNPKLAAANGGNHFGLTIMAARAARIGGQVTVDSELGQGTRVTLTWPVNLVQREGNGRVLDQEQMALKTA